MTQETNRTQRETLNPTFFPKALEKDFQFFTGRLQEKWRLYFPIIPLRLIRNYLTAANENRVAGIGLGGTIVDEQNLEGIPAASPSKEFMQPHSSVDSPDDIDPARPHRFIPPVKIHGRVQVDWEEYYLKKHGIEEEVHLEVTFLGVDLDKLGVLCNIGDELSWRDQDYVVHSVRPTGFWKNTDVVIFWSAFCSKKQEGS